MANLDRYGNPICVKCGLPRDYTQYGLTGICYTCYRVAREIRAILNHIPSRAR